MFVVRVRVQLFLVRIDLNNCSTRNSEHPALCVRVLFCSGLLCSCFVRVRLCLCSCSCSAMSSAYVRVRVRVRIPVRVRVRVRYWHLDVRFAFGFVRVVACEGALERPIA